MHFYNREISEILKELKTSESGLQTDLIADRLKKTGFNELTEKKKKSIFFFFLNQFKDFMILILMVAAIISGISGELTDTIIILIIILLNAIVGFLQEYRAEKAMEALKKLGVTQSEVLRDNQIAIIPTRELVPGDIVHLDSGNIVPADIRLIESFALKIDESSLTGESVAIDKNHHTISEENITLGDQFNIAFSGTLITNGRAVGVVVETGMRTELGKIASLLQEQQPITPLQKRMAKFGRNLSYFILLICASIFVSGILRGEDTFSVLLLAISLAVAAIPEALPALITVALSRGASRLAKKKALVKKLHAVETLGSVTFICSDKTGTLTQNKMEVIKLYDGKTKSNPDSTGFLYLLMSLNHDVHLNEKNEPVGEATELAIVNSVIKNFSSKIFKKHLEQYKRLGEIPFDSDRKCMTSLHQYNDRYLVITKGASESLHSKIISEPDKDLIHATSHEWASQGIRVLAFGYKFIDILPEKFSPEELESDLIFGGLVGMIDPPREEVNEAIRECKMAGIIPVMITGDHPETANAIAREIGILEDSGITITGRDLEKLSDAKLFEKVEKIKVYARVSPDQKIRIVRALQHKNHFVAMTGDGVNDAPSLRAANIGIAMGINGTDVSKEAADLILLDDNFATIVKAVKEGRRIFDNIRKFVKYILTCNGAEIWVITLAPLFGMPVPLLPIHILWINLVTDGLPALALASEKAEPDIMNLPPKASNESLFSNGVGIHIIWVGLLMAGVTLGTQAWTYFNENAHWQTMVFTVLSLSQLGHILAIRSDRTFLYKHGFLSNPPLLYAVMLTFGLQLMAIYVPFMNDFFKTQPLTFNEFGICLILSVLVFHAVELEKLIKLKLNSRKKSQRK